ncbi:DUF6795 domain-containing protein [Teredinibacter turnerae]|uniref:DUF6795 domain-containing protein n=1 Tax=Teredinibacter turnerae TaxID=2426 RepID=UPI0003FD1869|nr:DUF6795 domain-containing protein [Teredinibacter turnerae]
MKQFLILVAALLSGCSVFSFHKLTTDISGVVTKNGNPVEGAVITFQGNSHWYGVWDKKVIVTNENGEFEIPAWKKVRPLVLFHQPVIEQNILISLNNKIYEAWSYTRMSYADTQDGANGIFLSCELESDTKQQEVDGYRTAKGLCRAQ